GLRCRCLSGFLDSQIRRFCDSQVVRPGVAPVTLYYRPEHFGWCDTLRRRLSKVCRSRIGWLPERSDGAAVAERSWYEAVARLGDGLISATRCVRISSYWLLLFP